MTRWKKAMTMLAAAALTAALAVPAQALGSIDGETPGAVLVTVQDADYLEDLAAATVDVTMYKVADVNENGAFMLTEPFASLAAEKPEAWNGGILNYQYGDEQMMVLLDALLSMVEPEEPEEPAEGEPPEASPEPTASAEPEVITVQAVNGRIEPVEHGLYLVLPGGVETELWKYTFNPMLLAVPSIDREQSEWVYEVPVNLKGDRESQMSGIEIVKNLPAYNATLGATTFLFEVTAVKDGKVVYRNVVNLTFSGPGSQSVTVEGIPVGADVTVTEVYSGGSYQPADGQVTVTVDDLPLPTDGNYTPVPFTNDYTNERIPDGAVVNKYYYDGSGWVYEGEKDR